MKILFIAQNLSTLGGIQRVLNCLIDELIEIGNYEISVLMPKSNDNYKFFDVNDKVTIYDIDSLSSMNAVNNKLRKILLAINKRTGILNFNFFNNFVENLIINNEEKNNYINFINNNEYDVVIAAGDRYSLILGAIAKNINCKTIGWQHTTFDSYFCNRGKSSFGLTNVTKKLYNNLSNVLVLTKTDKKLFDNKFNINSIVFYNPLPKVNTKLSKGKNNNIIFLGRLVWDTKGLKYLIRIMKEVIKVFPNITCTVVGDGPDKLKLQKVIYKNNLSKNFNVVGKSNDVYKFYEKSDLLLQTSKYEGFGMTIIEAMSCGVPAVSFHNYGPDEIICDGIDGFLVDKYNIKEFSNIIVTLLSNYDFWKKISLSAKIRSKIFDLNVLTKEFIDIIETSDKNE